MHRTLGLFLIIGGAVAIAVGLALQTNLLSWFGKLPGDIRYSSDNVRVFIPITSMILVSIVLSLILWMVRRWL